jgi:hypothetical protein
MSKGAYNHHWEKTQISKSQKDNRVDIIVSNILVNPCYLDDAFGDCFPKRKISCGLLQIGVIDAFSRKVINLFSF